MLSVSGMQVGRPLTLRCTKSRLCFFVARNVNGLNFAMFSLTEGVGDAVSHTGLPG